MIRTLHLPRQNIIVQLTEVTAGYELSEEDFGYVKKELVMVGMSYDLVWRRSEDRYFISIQTAIDISFLVQDAK